MCSICQGSMSVVLSRFRRNGDLEIASFFFLPTVIKVYLSKTMAQDAGMTPALMQVAMGAMAAQLKAAQGEAKSKADEAAALRARLAALEEVAAARAGQGVAPVAEEVAAAVDDDVVAIAPTLLHVFT